MIITALIAIALLVSIYCALNFVVWLLMNHEQKLLNVFLVICIIIAFVIACWTVSELRRYLGL